MKKPFIIVFTISIIALPGMLGCSSLQELASLLGPAESETYLITDDDEQMNRAVEEAQATFDEFVSYFESADPGYVYFSVKARFATDDPPDMYEHIWLGEINLIEGGIKGRIGNVPDFVTYLELDQLVQVDMQDITDWLVVDEDGRAHGGTTIRLLRSRMSEAEQRQFDTETDGAFAED